MKRMAVKDDLPVEVKTLQLRWSINTVCTGTYILFIHATFSTDFFLTLFL